jgi:hypothetical protein
MDDDANHYIRTYEAGELQSIIAAEYEGDAELLAWLDKPEAERNKIHRRVRTMLRNWKGTFRNKGERRSCPECKSKLFFVRSSFSEIPPAPLCMACGYTPTRPHQTGELPIPEDTPYWVWS